MSKYFSFSRFLERIPQILPYLSVTFRMVAVAMLFGTLLGIAIALLRNKKIPVVRQILAVYISFMRGTPLLVQMCLAYYGIPILFGNIFQNVFGINLNRIDVTVYVIIAFILNEGAFLGEIFRGAIASVPAVQTEAGYSVGMTGLQTFRRIVFPQAVVIALPMYGVDLISVFQNTSIAFVVGVVEMMGKARTLGVSTGHTLEGFVVVALIYIMVSLLLKRFFYLLEKRWKENGKAVH